jgi:hypothetical protein
MALQAYGNIRLLVGVGTPTPVYSVVAGLKSIDGPNSERATIRATDLDSASQHDEFVAGYRNPGQLSAVAHYEPATAGHESLMAAAESGAATLFRVEFGPTGASGRRWQFSAIVTSIAPTAEIDGLIEATLTLQLSGVITRTTSA